MDMELTQTFLRGKNPCAMGYRWFVRNNLGGGDYQAAMDTQVAAGRVDDARWLLENFGPTNTVLELEHLEADHFVYAGTLIVHGDVRVTGQLLVGRSLQVGGGIRAVSWRWAKTSTAAAPSSATNCKPVAWSKRPGAWRCSAACVPRSCAPAGSCRAAAMWR